MPLFECEICRNVDNTALTNFWEAQLENTPKLCSECDPGIGRWHGLFDKVSVGEYNKRHPKYPVEYPAEGRNV